MRDHPFIPEPNGLFSEEAFINRELSQLSFFRRVLELASQEHNPLLERLRFLTICSTILDEFFEIRVAGLKERLRLGINRIGPDGISAPNLLSQINDQVGEIIQQQYHLLNQELLPQLEREGVRIIKRKDWSKKQKNWIQHYFRTQVAPVLTPIGLDPSHPFPQVLNKSLNVLLSLDGSDAFGRSCDYAVMHVPRCLPRVIDLPVEIRRHSDQVEFVLLSSVIHTHVEEVFPGVTVTGCHQFRVTRHADLDVDEEVEDLLDALKGELPGRRYGEGVRLEVANTCPKNHIQFLLEHFLLSETDLYRVNGPVNLNRLATVVHLVDRPDLKFPVFVPESFPNKNDMFELLQRRDILLHHPFQSFSPVVDLIEQAATDPDVLSIKQTVYRTGNESPFVDALIEAARAGKEVTAVIELRARFDEAANIDIASRLQSAGVHVVYGVFGYKTHAKMLMIVRRESGQLRRYIHLGTGNYHTGTARLYTDFSFLTSNQEMGEDTHFIFNQLTGLGDTQPLSFLIQAPFFFAQSILDALEIEIEEARAGNTAYMVAKLNSLSDPLIIEEMYKASQAGVKIDLIVRGICCLKPGVPGISENITVRSVVGRFLEHSRIYYFYRRGEEHLFLASADLMQRNLYRRVEVGFPILDPILKSRLIREGLRIYLEGTKNTWDLTSEGQYKRAEQANLNLTMNTLFNKGELTKSQRREVIKEQKTQTSLPIEDQSKEEMKVSKDKNHEPHSFNLLSESDRLEAQVWLLTRRQDP